LTSIAIVLSHPKDSSPMNGGEPTPWGSRTLTPVPGVGVRAAACARRSSKIPDSRLADDPEGATSGKTEKFIRNSSGIHPEFIRQSASSVLILRASGGKDSTERRRPGLLGKQLGAQRSSTDREEVAINGTPVRGRRQIRASEEAAWAATAPTLPALASKSRCRARQPTAPFTRITDQRRTTL
jgi:hypothetical protein